MWKHKRPQVAKTVSRRKNKARVITLPDFKLSFKTIIIKQYGTGPKMDT